MPYIDLAGLSRYASRQKDALARDYALLRDMQWTRSEKAGAVSLWPAGGTQLKPTVDFLFTETGPASGDKGPENPSTITGVSSVTLSHVGKNLLAYNFPTATVENGTTTTINGLTVTNTYGVYSISQTATKNTNVNITNLPLETAPLKIMPGTYTLSGYTAPTGAPAGTNLVLQMARNGVVVQTESCANGSSTFTLTGDTPVSCNVYIRTASGATYPSGFVCTPQLERGGEATVFEPSYVTSYTLPLGSTYYGGTLDVASGVMTVTWVGNVLTGNETITTMQTSVAGLYSFTVPADYYAKTGTGVSYKCTHFPAGRVQIDTFRVREVDGRGIIFYMESITTSQDFSNFLTTQYNNGTPVTVAYAIKTPYTVQLSPVSISALVQADKYTPRLNTVYTDAQAVQVGYVKSPIRDEYELTQAIAAQGGNV